MRAILASSALIATCLLVSAGSAAAAAGSRVAFVSDRAGHADVWSVNTVTGAERRLTSSPATDTLPRWSPTANRLLFLSDRDGKLRVYTMTGGGGNERAVSPDGLGEVYSAIWSPDGTRIAMIAAVAGPFPPTPYVSLFVMNANGGGLRVLSDRFLYCGAFTEADIQDPQDARVALSWSPDSRQIAFSASFSDLCAGPSIWRVPATGGAVTRASAFDRESPYFGPQWSPAGDRIAAYQQVQEVSRALVRRADGTGSAPVDSPLFTSRPTWAPDGSRLLVDASCAASCEVDAGPDVAVATLDGRLRALDRNPALRTRSGRFSPDGTQVVLEGIALQSGAHDLYVVRADGTGLRQLTDAPGADTLAEWRTRARAVATRRR